MQRNSHRLNPFLCLALIGGVTEQVTSATSKIFRFSRLGEYSANQGIVADRIAVVEVSRKWEPCVGDVQRKLMQYMGYEVRTQNAAITDASIACRLGKGLASKRSPVARNPSLVLAIRVTKSALEIGLFPEHHAVVRDHDDRGQ